MSETLPPASLTAKVCAWLRPASVAAVLTAIPAAAVLARTAPVRVVVGASVAETARATMSATLWTKMVDDWVAAKVVPFPNGLPSLDDCRNAAADYMVAAPFELRPRLPGMPNLGSGRVAARSHLVVTNCFTGSVVYDQMINFDSDPTLETPGEFESNPEVTWSKNVPATLARYPVFFPRVARIIGLRGPIALIDLRGAGLKPGDVLSVYAGADHKVKGPIYLTVTQVQAKYVEALISIVSGAQPAVGDYVEPAPQPSPAP